VRNPPGLATRPRQRPGFVAFAVADELVLLAPDGDRAHALNRSGAAVWGLCDGRHTARDMLRELCSRYDGEPVDMLADLTETLFQFDRLGLVDLTPSRRDGPAGAGAVAAEAAAGDRPRVRFVFGIEDKPSFRWQLAILFESLVGQLAPGWDVTVVVCNDHADLSAELKQLLDRYGVRAIRGTNHARGHDIDFAAGRGGYAALNRVEALKAIAGHVEADDVVCLMDTDLFLCGGLNAALFPSGNAMAWSRIMADPLFMGFGSRERGVDLQKLLGALGCERPLARGAVTVFLTGATLHDEKVIRDCFRFAQVLFLLGRVAALPEHNLWVAEMACFAMALTANGVDYAVLDDPQFAVFDSPQASVPDGSFFHYYTDVNDGRGGPFLGSEWNKQLFHDRDFLAEDLESFRAGAQGELERRFLDLAVAARRRRDDAHAI
jgi:hypothetical protein